MAVSKQNIGSRLSAADRPAALCCRSRLRRWRRRLGLPASVHENCCSVACARQSAARFPSPSSALLDPDRAWQQETRRTGHNRQAGGAHSPPASYPR